MVKHMVRAGHAAVAGEAVLHVALIHQFLERGVVILHRGIVFERLGHADGLQMVRAHDRDVLRRRREPQQVGIVGQALLVVILHDVLHVGGVGDVVGQVLQQPQVCAGLVAALEIDKIGLQLAGGHGQGHGVGIGAGGRLHDLDRHVLAQRGHLLADLLDIGLHVGIAGINVLAQVAHHHGVVGAADGGRLAALRHADGCGQQQRQRQKQGNQFLHVKTSLLSMFHFRLRHGRKYPSHPLMPPPRTSLV